MKKRLLAIIATVAMVVAMMPSMVFGESYTEWTSDNSLPTSGTYKLTKNVTLTNNVTIGAWSGSTSTLTLDLNGYTVKLTGSKNNILYVQNSGKLIIEDSVGTGKITNEGVTTTTNYVIQVKGSCEIKGGTIENTLSSGAAVHVQGETKQASCILNGGKILNSYASGAKAVNVASKAIFTMNGGIVESKATGTGGETSAINGGLIEIAGGKIVTPGTAVESNNDVKVTGGEIEAGTYAFKTNKLVVDPAEGKTVDVSAGVSVFNPLLNNSNNNSIKGGNFDAPMLSKPCEYDDSVVGVTGGTFKNGNEIMDVKEFIGGELIQDASGAVVEKPAPAPTQPTAPAKPTDSPNTGDNTVAPFAVAGLVLAAMAAAVVARRRYN
ncbi:MAG: LPXTG cell wall anchor domain-containing protein [Bacillota bacterium]|nr:LPXTG cell wall anchor domain-containing protein [Bacillota bacterium]